MSDLANIIAQLEKSDGPNFALEQEIMWVTRDIPPHQRHLSDTPPSYTASIDAALTLMPAEWEWALFSELGLFRVEFGDPAKHFETEYIPTAAIALCIAALKASAQQQDAPIAGERDAQS